MTIIPTDANLLDGARAWVEIETHTGDLPGLTELAALIAKDYAARGADVTLVPGRDGHGPHLIATLPASRPSGNAGVLILSISIPSIRAARWQNFRSGLKVTPPGVRACMT